MAAAAMANGDGHGGDVLPSRWGTEFCRARHLPLTDALPRPFIAAYDWPGRQETTMAADSWLAEYIQEDEMAAVPPSGWVTDQRTGVPKAIIDAFIRLTAA